MTATRKAAGAALVAGMVATAGLTACSNKPPTPSLYSRFGGQVNEQLSNINQDCFSAFITPSCVDDLNSLMQVFGDIRTAAKAENGSGKYADLLTTLDQADAHHQDFVKRSCDLTDMTGNCQFDVGDLIGDTGRVLHQMGN